MPTLNHPAGLLEVPTIRPASAPAAVWMSLGPFRAWFMGHRIRMALHAGSFKRLKAAKWTDLHRRQGGQAHRATDVGMLRGVVRPRIERSAPCSARYDQRSPAQLQRRSRLTNVNHTPGDGASSGACKYRSTVPTCPSTCSATGERMDYAAASCRLGPGSPERGKDAADLTIKRSADDAGAEAPTRILTLRGWAQSASAAWIVALGDLSAQRYPA